MTAQWKTLVDSVTNRMKDHIRPFTTPVLHEPNGGATVGGSGTYVETPQANKPVVLTCEHVMRLQPQKHWPDGTPEPVVLSGQVFSDRDVAPCA